jgi:hypothetical protein
MINLTPQVKTKEYIEKENIQVALFFILLVFILIIKLYIVIAQPKMSDNKSIAGTRSTINEEA